MSYYSKLKKIKRESDSDLEKAVIDEWLDNIDDKEDSSIKVWVEDLLQYGCQSGMVRGLIYYVDTNAFYDKHYDEIEELREELESDFGEPLKVKGDLKNWFAWLAFEETARKIADKIGIEI